MELPPWNIREPPWAFFIIINCWAPPASYKIEGTLPTWEESAKMATQAPFGVGMIALPTGILGASFVEEIQKQKGPKNVCPHCGKELS